jgi:predicted transcriptional regulator
MELPRVAPADPPCHTPDMAKRQAVGVQIDSDIAKGLERVAARLGSTVPAIADEVLAEWLDRWRVADGQRAVVEHFAEASFTEEEIAEADAWFDGVQAEAERMLTEDQDAEDPQC